ncbi:hypothetical protein BDK51DRAFT_45999 [Blyttiomyces helicus]|uniref:Uncharacterized protein n=1 Tax=Blyttiomyces helicus TaxID=388810 RepID=A0A4P9WEU0_9FUNG|nr:hypothetical protein BDK51DRAFT_45999 [Blyttiomyces helicus]|eukprot:RKO89798.1 hypothetical protein BDK51DRAFT_45999 [Blyttiomyces helicus]
MPAVADPTPDDHHQNLPPATPRRPRVPGTLPPMPPPTADAPPFQGRTARAPSTLPPPPPPSPLAPVVRHILFLLAALLTLRRVFSYLLHRHTTPPVPPPAPPLFSFLPPWLGPGAFVLVAFLAVRVWRARVRTRAAASESSSSAAAASSSSPACAKNCALLTPPSSPSGVQPARNSPGSPPRKAMAASSPVKIPASPVHATKPIASVVPPPLELGDGGIEVSGHKRDSKMDVREPENTPDSSADEMVVTVPSPSPTPAPSVTFSSGSPPRKMPSESLLAKAPSSPPRAPKPKTLTVSPRFEKGDRGMEVLGHQRDSKMDVREPESSLDSSAYEKFSEPPSPSPTPSLAKSPGSPPRKPTSGSPRAKIPSSPIHTTKPIALIVPPYFETGMEGFGKKRDSKMDVPEPETTPDSSADKKPMDVPFLTVTPSLSSSPSRSATLLDFSIDDDDDNERDGPPREAPLLPSPPSSLSLFLDELALKPFVPSSPPNASRIVVGFVDIDAGEFQEEEKLGPPEREDSGRMQTGGEDVKGTTPVDPQKDSLPTPSENSIRITAPGHTRRTPKTKHADALPALGRTRPSAPPPPAGNLSSASPEPHPSTRPAVHSSPRPQPQPPLLQTQPHPISLPPSAVTPPKSANSAQHPDPSPPPIFCAHVRPVRCAG